MYNGLGPLLQKQKLYLLWSFEKGHSGATATSLKNAGEHERYTWTKDKERKDNLVSDIGQRLFWPLAQACQNSLHHEVPYTVHTAQ